MFQMENPLMRMLTKIGNFILVSFYWLLTCIPVVTIIPACTALFHTVTKVIRQDGEGVTADFFFFVPLPQAAFVKVFCPFRADVLQPDRQRRGVPLHFPVCDRIVDVQKIHLRFLSFFICSADHPALYEFFLFHCFSPP